MEVQNIEVAKSAAKRGIIASALLFTIEFTGGVISGSLGLTSSALNTLMNFFAALILFFAIKESSKPPDEAHMYGHEKIESIAAIGELLLLFVVCCWIAYRTIQQLLSGGAYIEFFWLALTTNFISIFINLLAYLSLNLASKKRKSGAVEAGALHFMNDLLIAVVVIVGLMFYNFGIYYADAIAALGIVAFMTASSFNVVRDALIVLTDAAPRGVVKRLREKILSVEGVVNCHKIRVRQAGSKFFVDAHVEIDGHIPLDQAHSIASRIEERIRSMFPNSDVLIHTEPYTHGDPIGLIRSIAFQIPEIKGIHQIVVKRVQKKLSISYHLELDSNLSVKEAHEVASRLERRLKESVSDVYTVISHLEPTPEHLESAEYDTEKLSELQRRIIKISEEMPEVKSLHNIQILASDGKHNVSLHCVIDGSMSLDEAHKIISQIEDKIKRIDRDIEQVIIHCEPN